ncbi:PREDICTED: B-cell receptor-associated protein 31-like [Fragaria vesca subsp. vesca]|uniref:B-cell receptor-associated protein 31-like n=1 Tax=Fragaria vesca subsp. vesca TaxID=101020 RepID=UPI0002C30B89|nr:PREDICTED: B-cell receptor-associated protein 31-like [Fragaria vesca subsp. vesca]
MMQLLYTAIFSQMALILTLLFKSPLRKLVILGLDKLKRGKGPVVVKTVGGTVAAVLCANIYNLNELKSRTNEAGMLNPTDEVLMSMKLLEISLMGFFLFLSLMIDRLHHYIRELRFLRKAMEAAKKQNQPTQEEKSEGHKTLVQENETLRAKVKNLESEHETKEKKAKATGAEVQALKKQSEGLLLEYDRLLEENQHLRDQLKSIDRSMSHSDDKKKT